MRHRLHHRKLNRTAEHRAALRRNMAQSLIEHNRITTTTAKAKDLRPFVERLVTLAVKVRRTTHAGDMAAALRARRAIHRLLGDRAIIPADHRSTYDSMSDSARLKRLRMVSGRRHRTGDPKGRLAFTAESVVHRLVDTIAPRYLDRPGGYTRLVRLADRRLGDKSTLAMLQLVGDEEAPTSLTKPRKSARRRRADARYAMAIAASKSWTGKQQPDASTNVAESGPEPPDVDTMADESD
ncbi:MAG: 50S ribosomal protein L17 [Phycisphaerae bacterium]